MIHLSKLWSQRFFQIAVESSDLCILDCPACRRPSPGRGYMKPETFRAIMEKLKGETKRVLLMWKGEPTMSPYLPDLTEIAAEYGVWTRMATDTCVVLKEDYVRRLMNSLDVFKVCVDGYDQESLQKYRRGGKWDVLIKNLETISRIEPRKSELQMCVLMFRYNEGHEDKFRALASRYGMDVIRWRPPIINGHTILTDDEARDWLAEDPRYRRYELRHGFWVHKEPPRFMIPVPTLDINGDVYGCCRDRYMTAKIGNILEDGLWKLKLRLAAFTLDCYRRRYEFCTSYCWEIPGPGEIEEVVTEDPSIRPPPKGLTIEARRALGEELPRHHGGPRAHQRLPRGNWGSPELCI